MTNYTTESDYQSLLEAKVEVLTAKIDELEHSLRLQALMLTRRDAEILSLSQRNQKLMEGHRDGRNFVQACKSAPKAQLA